MNVIKRLKRIELLEAEHDEAEDVDPALHDWYGGVCPCGLEPGQCCVHHRARPAQRPPPGDWRAWAYVAGRGAGKTAAGAHWIQYRVEAGTSRCALLIAPTQADIRDTLLEGPSGLLSIAPPWCRPRFERSKRRVSWPNGAIAICISGEEPDRARGLNVDTIWADELACWQRARMTWDIALLCLRAGADPRACITTTPRRGEALKSILGQPTTVRTTETTYANQQHLAPGFLESIVARYEGTRLGRQEVHAEILEMGDEAWFACFSAVMHVKEAAEYRYGQPVYLAIDCGVSRYTGAVWYQVSERGPYRKVFSVFADYLSVDLTSEQNALAIKQKSDNLPSRGWLNTIVLDPAAVARTGIGPAARGEYQRVFGERLVSSWPLHRVLDGLDQLEVLLGGPHREPDLVIHPRCRHLIDALTHYRHAERRGELLDTPDELQHPYEDLVDALRGGVRSHMPEGRAPGPELRHVHA